MRRPLLLLLGALLAVPAAAQTLVAIGGALRFEHRAVWQRIVAEAGGPGARFVVLATAAGNPARAAERAVEALQREGAMASWLPVAPALQGVDLKRELQDPAHLARLQQADGVFFTGGAQALIVDTLRPGGRPTALLEAIWALYRRGGVIAGTSAGAAAMSHTMFRDAPDVQQALLGRLREGHEIGDGLGFAGPELLIDQHFLRRGRLARLLPLMVARGYRLGLGIEEDSAVVIGQGRLEAVGRGGALLVDLGAAAHDPALGAFNLRGARLSFLADGDSHELSSGQTRAAAGRTAMPAPGPAVGAPAIHPELLREGALLRAMAALLAPGAGEAFGRVGDFEFRLYRDAATRGWREADDAAAPPSIAGMGLDVRPLVPEPPQ
ncbi:cyanophycinase [Roseateles sp. DAIF2]|uniref:cyanophycinase n=1 Tax=Roseateles sp. DAIF2 TaxID=2714952 RepID=UPI0018A2D276|nr:cyanophycinase [Roseateles sp. DAIF2]QPF73321.1 cyanophycinase [Roseateles sp. DAIF2]